jgi:small GTP-binding protein
MLKLITIGDISVGKTSLLQYICFNKPPPTVLSTVGCGCFFIKSTYRNQVYTIQAWDCAGSERFRSVVNLYVRKIHIILYVFDRTNPKSFEGISEVWQPFIDKNLTIGDGFTTPIIFLIENKIDQPDQHGVSPRAAELAKKEGWIHLMTSASKGTGISELCDRIMEEIYYRKNSPAERTEKKDSGTIVDLTDDELETDSYSLSRCSTSVGCNY